MPGIVGLVTTLPREQAIAELHCMLASMQHEHFYRTRIWSDESLGVYIGSVEREGSFANNMPILNEHGDTVLVFSGEDYPATGTSQLLKQRGHIFDANDSSYLVHQYEDSPDFFEKLNGIFHGIVVDRCQAVATLFNDRYGMHRIYYHESTRAFYFASEAKAILSVRPELRSIDPRGLSEFISCGCTLENRTIFKNIYVLPPASAWTFRHALIEHKKAYFNCKEWEDQPVLDSYEFYNQLRNVFSRNLSRYFAGHENVGISLTGGLDSRMIMAWHKGNQGTLPCYTFGGIYRDCQDVTIARKVAQACGQTHNVLTVGEDFLSQFPYYSERAVFLTDGCVTVENAPDLYINKYAAAIAPVRITGNYGSEVLRLGRAFKPVNMAPGLIHPDLSASIELAIDTYRAQLLGHPVSFAAFRQAPWHHYGLLCLEQTQLTLRTPYLDNEIVKTIYRAPISALSSDSISLQLIKDGNPALLRIRTDRGLGGSLPGFAAEMQQGYLKFMTKAEYAYDYGMPQFVARLDHAFSRLHFERLFLGRNKFYHYRIWYRDALSNYVREMLLDSRTLNRPYLQRDTLVKLVNGHLNGNRNYTTEIHKILTLEHIHRLFID
jgi:asparagine synthase (glutamine-hydrolysing)